MSEKIFVAMSASTACAWPKASALANRSCGPTSTVIHLGDIESQYR
jgi:hypothetical protein